MYAQTDNQHADRIQIFCTPFLGPFTQIGPLGTFDPRRDLVVYVDGDLVPVRGFFFDSTQNRYLLFMDRTINVQGVIQVVHHMPSPPFVGLINPPLFDLTPGEEPDIDEGG